MGYRTQGRSSPRGGKQDRSKRQERVGHLVRTELSTILHKGVIKGDADYLEDELRQRISVINADVSPDLRQARITVSIRKGLDIEGSNPAVDRRRAYSWLVQNTKAIRHTLAQNLKYMKSVPNLSFAQADVAAAVDVMYLIDKVAEGYKRKAVGEFGGDDDSLPRGMVGGIDFDEDEEIEWIDEDEDFFSEEESDNDKNGDK
jgi:ribosome-binding factor A